MWGRPWEALSHTAIILAVFTQYLGTGMLLYNWALMSLHIGWIVFKVIGARMEGIRIAQVINGFCFLMWTLYFLSVVAFVPQGGKFNAFTKTNTTLTLLVVVFWLQNVFYTQMLGATDFSALQFDGPYKVGVRYFHTRTADTETMVFYPIDDDEYESKLETHNTFWLRHPEKWIAAQQFIFRKFLAWPVPKCILRQFKQVKLDCVLDATLSRDFVEGKRILQPILFSHGIFGSNNSYTGLLKDMASHGYIVFALNHADGSCIYTETSLGSGVPLGSFDYYDKDYRRSQIDIRLNEMLSAAKDLTEMERSTYNQVFGSAARGVQLNNELIVCGHSFGGLTALITAAKLGQQCKAVCVMDPFLHAYEAEILSGDLKVTESPLQVINSEKFHPALNIF